NRALEVSAPVISVEEEIKRKNLSIEPAGEQGDIWNAGIYRLKYRSPSEVYDARVNLRGRHQITNALTAIEIAEQLRIRGFEIARKAVIDGLEQVRWPGRLEMIRLCESSVPLLLDGAHNAAGAAVLRDFLRDNFSDKTITLIFGAMADKAIAEM